MTREEVDKAIKEAVKPLLERIDQLTEIVDKFNEKQSGLGDK